MKKSRFGEEQIIAVLKEQEAGMPTAEVCRRHGISSATFYKWKSKFGGLEVSDARRLRTLEQENSRLKKLLAEAMLDNVVLYPGTCGPYAGAIGPLPPGLLTSGLRARHPLPPPLAPTSLTTCCCPWVI